MSEPDRCKRCGGPLQAGPLGGACPRCMMELGMVSASGNLEDPDSTLAVSRQAPQDLGTAARPTVIGRYRILRLIGEGGMGAVYEAEQDQPRRTVALKIIKPGIASPELLRRFDQESHALGRLQHPGIAQIYEAGTADTGFGPQPYFAMEFIRGTTLKDYAEEQHLNTRQRLEMVSKIADAVQHAHQRGLIHRDLKPVNIMVDESGQPKILDFGVARATDSDSQATSQTDIGQLVGTLAYMSPEQVLADPLELDTRSDVYALGVILYELLAGRLPYTISKKLHETIHAIREEDPAKLSSIDRAYRGDIETIAAKALEKDKTRRYGSAAELAADIQRYLHDEPIVARPPSTKYQLQKFARRHKALVAGVVAVFIVFVGGIVASTLQATRANRERDRAVQAETKTGVERDRATAAQLTATMERDNAKSERNRADTSAANANEQRLITIWRSLARESVRDSTSRADDDRAALLARQAMLFHAQTPNQAQYLVEDALQQVARLETFNHNISRGPKAPANSVAFSPDGARLALGSSDNTVRLWDLRNPDAQPVVLSSLPPSGLDNLGSVMSVAFSPDGNRLASVDSDKTVRLWDLRNTGAQPDVLKVGQRSGLSSSSTSVAFSPDGSRLVSGGDNNTARVWDLRNPGAPPQLFQGPQPPAFSTLIPSEIGPNVVISVAFSPDGRRLVAGGDDKTVRVWDLRNPGAPPLDLQGHQGVVRSVAFSADNGRLASASLDRTVRVWDLRNPGAPPLVLQGDQKEVYSVAFSPDGRRLASAGLDKTVRLWDLSKLDAQPVLLQASGYVFSVAFSPDGARLASGSDDTARVWDLLNPRVPRVLLPGPPPAGARIMSILSGVNLITLTYPGDGAPLAFSADGTRLASGSLATATPGFLRPVDGMTRDSALLDNAVRLWDLRNPTVPPLLLRGHEYDVRFVAFSPDGMRLASAGIDDTVRVWNLRNPGAPSQLRQDPPLAIRTAPSSPPRPSDNRLIPAVRAVAFSPDGARLAATGIDKIVRVWDLRNSSVPTKTLLQGMQEGGFITRMTFSPDISLLASVVDRSIKVWDLRNPGAPPSTLVKAEGMQAFVIAMAFSLDGARLASANGDRSISVWDVRNPSAAPTRFGGHDTPTFSLAFSPDGWRLASGAADYSVRIWDLRNPSAPPVVMPQAARESNLVAFSPDGRRLSSFTSADLGVQVWPLWSAAADFICTRVSRNLSMDEWRFYVGEDIPYERTCPALPAGAGVK